MTNESDKVGSERAHLNFADAVGKTFAFLDDYGFSNSESLPTLVRYRKGNLEVSVYHGRQSYEVGFEITAGGNRYSMSELIRASDPAAARQYRSIAATTADGIEDALVRLAELTRHYAQRALQGDRDFFSLLEEERKFWLERYALEVLAGELRPKAEAAFRHGDYEEASALYEQIRPCLSATQLKKLEIAKRRTRR